MTPDRLEKIQRTLNLRQPDLTVLTDEVQKDRNLSAIVRSADAFAIPKVHCVWEGGIYHVARNQAAGAGTWVDVITHSSITAAIGDLKDQGFRVCAAHFTERAVDYRTYDFTQPTAILLGAEREGVSEEAAALCDEHLIIPMLGMTQSFNVSVAGALILSEAARQRQQAGMFAQRRIDDDEYQRLLFEWCQPQITAFCQERGLPYPALGEDGELADPQGFSALVNGQR
ncbi:MAG: tRNA (guanosine(18)-2'-O)-methyltransferase TrmH [Oceanospirillaceae bacterium]|nr:tRNA (guanosine(18)-2'-O)-methyltransferase TrmH [Oceanospirillaceae bacterium]MBT13429.1 tRNA (guanosine(18)-2'-O)-methyltransferase TrmH [Oceanospirillaceae bacterium]